MKKYPALTKKQFKNVWEKYHDTLWKIEQAWDDHTISLDKRTELTDTVVEMIAIEKKLKNLESKFQKN